MYKVNKLTFETKEEVDAFLLTATYVNTSGCTALTELYAPVATSVYAGGCAELTELSAPMATCVYASGCTALTELSAPMATYVNASGCAELTELSAPMATYVNASGCAELTELSAPMATYVNADHCTKLASCNGYSQLSDSECQHNLKVVAALALASPSALQMDTVHSCETTHCISGWAIFNHPNGRDMRSKLGWWLAGKFLLGNEAASHFYDSQKNGRAYLRSVV